MKLKFSKNEEAGQTLIETVTAIAILLTALMAGLGATYSSLNSSDVSKKQIIATNLAREGVDVIRMMRDTNWLTGPTNSQPVNCLDIGGKLCYQNAFSNPYNFQLPAGGGPVSPGGLNPDKFFRVKFNTDTRTWELDDITGTSNENYLLCLQPNGTYQHNAPGNSGVECTNGGFARRIAISTRQIPGFVTPNAYNMEVTVQSIVRWSGRNCPSMDISEGQIVMNTTPAPCKVIVEERLTNWKDYR
ncbi:MAG: type II secretion system protein [Acidobacteriaceae bacterium]